ncbi:hypothetical protein BGZ83_009281 [Gryganskiella cystojenkinii]|nr:hypothetical protein BGZ83_009281 [Gryganskiella cystojenkinii]
MASVSPVKKRSKKKPRTDPESPLMTATNTAIVIDDDNDLVQPEDTLSSPLLAPANPRDMTRTVALIVQDTVERATIGMVIPDAEERTNTATPESVLEPTFGRTAETPVFEYVPRRAQDPAVLESPHACSVETAHDRLKTESPGKENQEDKAEDEEPPGPRLDKGKGRAVEAMNSLFSSGSTRTAATEIITKPNNIHAKVGNGDGKAFVAPLSERTRVIPNVAPVEHTSISTISGGGSAIPLTVERKRLLLKKKQPLNF